MAADDQHNRVDQVNNEILKKSLFVSLVSLVAYYGVSLYLKPADIPAGIVVDATPAPEVMKEDKIEVAVKPPVKVYKPAVKRSLKLPENITTDAAQHVIASSKTANDERQHTITTVINQHTGEVQSFDRAEPLPWVAVNTKSEVGIYYGLKSGEPALRIEGRQELLQVKYVHVGAIASADMTRSMGTDGFIGVGAWARW